MCAFFDVTSGLVRLDELGRVILGCVVGIILARDRMRDGFGKFKHSRHGTRIVTNVEHASDGKNALSGRGLRGPLTRFPDGRPIPGWVGRHKDETKSNYAGVVTFDCEGPFTLNGGLDRVGISSDFLG